MYVGVFGMLIIDAFFPPTEINSQLVKRLDAREATMDKLLGM